LTEDRARKVIETTVAEIMESIGAPVERKTVRQHFDSWLKAFEAERTSGTFIRYKGIADQFLGFLGARASASLTALRSDDVEKYRDYLLERVAPRTVNTHLKVVRVALEKAVKQGIFDRNPARLVDNVNTNDRHERRAFTLSELKKLLAVASEDWKTAVLFGIYTGLRLGDVQSLTWANLDLSASEVSIRTQKTNRVQILPLAKPLLRHIENLPVGDDPKQPLCPALADRPVNSLSNEFFELLAAGGLVQSRKDHRKKKQGRGARRSLSEISFHSLRHTATSLLKNAGVNDVVARDIIGHESEAVSRNYTHIDSETKRAALDKMPDVLS
jgi:integrase